MLFVTQELRAANADWDSAVGFLHPPPMRCRERWALRPRAEGNAHRSSNGSNKEESKTREEEKNPQKSSLKTRKQHYWLIKSSLAVLRVCVAKFFVFSPWRPCLGVSALAARTGRAGRSEQQDAGCSAQHSAEAFRDREKPPLLLQPPEHLEPAGLPRSHQAGNRFDSI